ncbi:HNH endonuclease [Streptomyces sp. NPDC047070]|uniref:HNH endonuclease n=1 Tax=Streptomyces sp. NPDC047070 TaxID=3154923 RepID=UPI003453C9B2
MAGNPRTGRPYRRLTAQQRALGLPCWLCGREIDYTLTGYAAQRDRWAFTLDHAQPVSKRPDLLLDPANARSAHRRCNSQRGNRTVTAPVRASRRW